MYIITGAAAEHATKIFVDDLPVYKKNTHVLTAVWELRQHVMRAYAMSGRGTQLYIYRVSIERRGDRRGSQKVRTR